MRRSGFTLMELLLVVAILVILAALGLPSIERMYGGLRLEAAGDQVRANWSDARAHAIDDGRPYRFAINTTSNKIRVAPDSDEYWNGSIAVGVADEDGTMPLIQEQDLPKGVTLGDHADTENTDTINGWQRVATFQIDGTTREDQVEIRFDSKDFASVVVRMRGLTGSVTTKTIPLSEK